ncbi:DeoR faimly transcriptional regulator [Sporolactobacillus inulinus CASD]|uniref:Riboflavin biosynthesis protein RibD n=1 Tax=Sporolactobacillus inulinus CASD TaxID=1069536 RepID=A0A0U1QL98_9BACL|nr:bifunctional diaminohydroxyphosphoribosylaminopyrimidine deaminase/5-amino-6-(5-phosphoribosylamino)uracil reductase RibD [Sporolactobacillus inulinus]KLI01531.1 DeoR faimly transcriptional regulator [Sporolactobacillus inulinus CASD]GEB77725.1 riboflavin biosynthesis protein RibD [Sporolactobacillus inulinus]
MDERFMKKAIELAEKGGRNTYRNPRVGAVIVKNNRIIATGYHAKFGEKHAERMAIDHCAHPEELHDSTLYVTLEPCTHYGKQPPCVQAIIDSGIKRVVIGQLDPNPIVAHKGAAILKAHQIDVKMNCLTSEAESLNKHYNYFYRHKKPYIVLKQALSLDGKIAAKPGERTAITGKRANRFVHEERLGYQAILVGSGTVLADNPILLPSENSDYPPIRIIVDRSGKTLHFEAFKLFEHPEPIWIFTRSALQEKAPDHVKIIQTDDFSIPKIVDDIGQQGVQSIYVEGGAQIHHTFLQAHCYEEVITYLAPKLIGGTGLSAFSGNGMIDHENNLTFKSIERIGEDLRIVSERVK